MSHDVNATSASNSKFINIQENIVRGSVGGGYAQQVSITKNIIHDYIANFNGGVLITNNIFLKAANIWAQVIVNVQSGMFQNNILIASGSYIGGEISGSGFYNNIFSGAFTIPAGCYGSGNIVNKPQGDIFIQQSGNVFSYDHNNRLKPESGGIGAGSDGFNIGIYGSPVPYKDGAVPYTPHITSQSISSESDPSGKINISINVKAQER